MKRIGRLMVVLLFVLFWAGPALAQQPAPKKAPTAATDEFVPVDAPVTGQDAMPAPRLVAIAYGFIWLVFFGYLLSIKTRLSKVEQEMAALNRRQP